MSTWLRKTKGVPGSAPGGYEWNTTDDVVEVTDDWLAADLLDIPDAGFVSVAAPETPAEDGGADAGESGEADSEDSGDTGQKPAAASTRGARKTATSKAAASKTQVSE